MLAAHARGVAIERSGYRAITQPGGGALPDDNFREPRPGVGTGAAEAAGPSAATVGVTLSGTKATRRNYGGLAEPSRKASGFRQIRSRTLLLRRVGIQRRRPEK